MKTVTKLWTLVLLLLAAGSLWGQASSGFTKIASTASTSYIDSTCPDQTTCYYQVTAVDSTGHESQAAVCATNQLCFSTNEAVAQMPSSGTHTVTVNWTASTTSNVTYNVYQHLGPVSPGPVSATVN